MELLNDFSTSVRKAFDEIDPRWETYNGVVICGTWPGDDGGDYADFATRRYKNATAANIPVLGICFGMQIMAVSGGHKLVKLPERHVGIDKTCGWWGESYESFWHDYCVKNSEGIVINAMQSLDPYAVGVQFHPEYQSSKDKPHIILVDFLNACKNQK